MIAFDGENRRECCGCAACAAKCPVSCIKMTPDAEGFSYPAADKERCTDCGLCESVCPVKNRPALGGVPEAYAVRSTDGEVLDTSSSGGAFTSMARAVLAGGGVVFGVAFGRDWQVVHKMAGTPEEAKAFRGSKYVQSDMGGCYQEAQKLLESGKPVLFSGTPCQIAGLRNFLGKPYPGLTCVDIVCHGVPSPKVWKEYLELMTRRHGRIEKINFRAKTYGYHSGAMQVDFYGGKAYRGSARVDPMLKCFFSEAVSRPSCYACAFKTLGRESDITLFDCWSAGKLVPAIKDDDRGYTALLVHTEGGGALLEKCAASLAIFPVDTEEAVRLDGSMVRKSTSPHPRRQEFFETLEREGLEKAFSAVLPVTAGDRLAERSKLLFYRLGLTGFIKKFKNLVVKR